MARELQSLGNMDVVKLMRVKAENKRNLIHWHCLEESMVCFLVYWELKYRQHTLQVKSC